MPAGKAGRVLAVGSPWAVQFTPDGTRLGVAGHPGLFLFDATPGATAGAERVLSPDTMFDSVAFSPDGSLIAALTYSGRCQVFDAATGTLGLRLPGPGENAWRRLRNRAWSRRLMAADFTGDGSELATVALDGVIRVWDAATGELRSSAHRSRGRTGRSTSRSSCRIRFGWWPRRARWSVRSPCGRPGPAPSWMSSPCTACRRR